MADKTRRLPENPHGAYYVDIGCIDCDMCRHVAPDHFRRSDGGRSSYVYKQPVTVEEMEECEEARGWCPVDAIGTDG